MRFSTVFVDLVRHDLAEGGDTFSNVEGISGNAWTLGGVALTDENRRSRSYVRVLPGRSAFDNVLRMQFVVHQTSRIYFVERTF